VLDRERCINQKCKTQSGWRTKKRKHIWKTCGKWKGHPCLRGKERRLNGKKKGPKGKREWKKTSRTGIGGVGWDYSKFKEALRVELKRAAKKEKLRGKRREKLV